MCDYGWDEVDANVICQQMGFTYQRALPTNNSHFGAGEGPILLENVRCNQSHSNLSQCVDYFKHIGTVRRCMHTAGVICEDMTMSTSTELVPTTDQTPSTSPHATTANISHDNTYTSYAYYDTTLTASNSSVVAIVVTVGALILLAMAAAITVIALVLIARLRLKANR